MNIESNTAINPDLLVGAPAIAEGLRQEFGGHWTPRRVRWAAENQSLPLFRIGHQICGRRSTLRQYVADLETNAVQAVTKA